MVTSSSAIATEIFAVVGEDYHLRHLATRSVIQKHAHTERDGYCCWTIYLLAENRRTEKLSFRKCTVIDGPFADTKE